MEKRVFLAIFLSFAILVLYQAYFAPPPPKPQTPPAASTATNTAPAAGSPAAPAATSAGPTAPATAEAPAEAAVASRDVAVETDTVSAVFTTKGGALKSWKLNKYFEEGHPLDLIPQNIPDTLARPFTLAGDDATTSAALKNAAYQPSADSLSLGSSAGALTFTRDTMAR